MWGLNIFYSIQTVGLSFRSGSNIWFSGRFPMKTFDESEMRTRQKHCNVTPGDA